jgi:hypothetical protein
MNNLLLSDRLVNQLFAEPSVIELYNSEKVVPKTVIFQRRANAMAQLITTTPSTQAFLGRVMLAGTRALGYLQIARPQTTVQAQQVIAVLKTLAFSSGNYMKAVAKPNLNTSPGILQVGVMQASQDAIRRIELYDPAFIHLISTKLSDGTYRVTVEGAPDFPSTTIPGGLFELDPVRDYITVLDGITFPAEVLF